MPTLRRLGQRVLQGMTRDARTTQDHTHRLDEDAEVERRRLAPDVLQVELDAGGPVNPVPAPHLSETGHSWADAEALPLRRRVPRHLVGERGTGTDDAHLAAGDVDQLRKLVERQPSQHVAHRCNPLGVGEDWVAFGRVHHRAELDDLERPAAESDPLLAKEDRSF
jgi:hypothetical protein